MIEKFIDRMRNIRNFSENTIKNYTRTLSAFNNFLIKSTLGTVTLEQPEWITLHLINSYISVESAKGEIGKTTNNKLAGIRCFIKFCMVEWRKVINPQRIISARENQLKIESLTNAEARQLLNYFKSVTYETDTEELIKMRNLLICSLFLYTGLRCNELSHLKRSEIAQEFQVIGKGWVRRYVKLSQESRNIFELYELLRKDDSDRLFISHAYNSTGARLTNASIERIIREGGKNAGITKNIYPHLLRHTFATELLVNNVEIIKIQRLMGHKNITTTQNYITVRDKALQEAVGKLNFW